MVNTKIMKKIGYAEKEDRISIKEYFDLVEYFNRNLVMGIECERPITIQTQILASQLNTISVGYSESHNAGLNARRYRQATTNEYNVAFVTTDGTVHGGNEIIFNGTIEPFKWIHSKLTKLEKKLDSMGCLPYHSSASNHITFVTLQDKLINPILLKNIFNLSRAFSSSLYWLCSGDKETIVRSSVRIRGGMAQPHLTTTPKGKSSEELGRSTSKYSLCNVSKQGFITVAGKNLLSGLVVEFRNTDCIRVPSALTSIMFLYRALIYKAIEHSTKGLVEIESIINWKENKELTKKILIHELTDDDKRKLFENSTALIDYLTPQLKSMSHESIQILKELAKNPISARNQKNDKIEKDLQAKYNTKLTEKEERIVEYIFGNEIQEATAGKWKQKVSEELGVSDRMVEYMIAGIEKKTNSRIAFDKELRKYMIR